MTTVQFTCSACAQTIEVNEEMRETILETGCPVCTTDAAENDFSDAAEDDVSDAAENDVSDAAESDRSNDPDDG
ncbi:MAG: hypothetical protein R6U01_14765 [Halorubrum sp.]